MILNQFSRYINTNSILWQSASKSLLAELRKKTGYTFVNCKKALEIHNNDLEKAESWLRDQAQSLGWSKAQKLQGRAITQGLITTVVDNDSGALIEINCETDFVARNKEFHGLADLVASAVLTHNASALSNSVYNKTLLDGDSLNALLAFDGKSIADHSVLTIGTLGENIAVKRALCVRVPPGVKLAGFTHPASEDFLPITHGKYGALLAYKTTDENEDIGKHLCQHIIGLNPLKIGDPTVDQPTEHKDDETTLIHQEYLLEPGTTVQEMLTETNTQILDFVRFEMGETIEGQQSLDAIETGG